jgi:two-component sensor histidine kinase
VVVFVSRDAAFIFFSRRGRLPEGFEESRDSRAGLTLMRLLAENIGGRLSVNSHALGLTVTIRLPPMLRLVESN